MIQLTPEVKEQLNLMFKELGQDSLTMTHYELANTTAEPDPEVWKAFLKDPEMSEWIKEELDLLQSVELNKLMKNAASSRSVGQAQLINTFSKLNVDKDAKEGPVFIYTYVPPSPEQKFAPNYKEDDLQDNPFIKRPSGEPNLTLER